MSHLLQAAIAAHGGLDRWNSYRKVSLDLSVGGALWDFKGQTGLFRDAYYEAELDAQRAILGRFGGPDQRVRFSPNRLVLETASGEPIESRENPRGAFRGHQNDTPWDRFHAAYSMVMRSGRILHSPSFTPIPDSRPSRSSRGRKTVKLGGG